MAVPAALVSAFLLSAVTMLPDAPSGGPAATVDDLRPAAAAPSVQTPGTVQPGTARQWPISPRPAVLQGFSVGPYRWSPGHRGVDLASAPGTVVRAAERGVVGFAGPLAGRGVVVILHPGGLRTTYEPVQSVVRRGQRIDVGQQIGRLQATGSHCAPVTCLHWGALRGQTYLDPLSLVGRRPPPVLLPLDVSSIS